MGVMSGGGIGSAAGIDNALRSGLHVLLALTQASVVVDITAEGALRTRNTVQGAG